MVVEDHDDVRDVLVLELEAFGAYVMSANSAAQALTYMKVVRPDVLVSDLSMPGKDGFELLQEVRSSPVLMNVPAIAITGHGDLRAKADRSGYQRFMEKPIDTEGLCRAIGELAGGGRAAPA
jgi:CheY-like chemotaxis protein